MDLKRKMKLDLLWTTKEFTRGILIVAFIGMVLQKAFPLNPYYVLAGLFVGFLILVHSAWKSVDDNVVLSDKQADTIGKLYNLLQYHAPKDDVEPVSVNEMVHGDDLLEAFERAYKRSSTNAEKYYVYTLLCLYEKNFTRKRTELDRYVLKNWKKDNIRNKYVLKNSFGILLSALFALLLAFQMHEVFIQIGTSKEDIQISTILSFFMFYSFLVVGMFYLNDMLLHRSMKNYVLTDADIECLEGLSDTSYTSTMLSTIKQHCKKQEHFFEYNRYIQMCALLQKAEQRQIL